MVRRAAAATTLTLAAAGSAVAGAQTPTVPPPAPAPVATAPAPPPAPAPAPVPPPAQAQAKLRLQAERVGAGGAVLAGAGWRVRGTVTPYVAGQQVTVRFYRGTKKLRARAVTVRPSSTGRSGTFLVGFSSGRSGSVTVRASHRATAELATVVARAVRVTVLPRYAAPGSSGAVVRLLQSRLAAMGYVVGRRGSYDGRTARAVQAFRKSTGLARTFVADKAVFAKLAAGAGRFKVRYPSHGRHVEADLSKQVLALIGAGGKVERIYPTSSGKPSTPTILGSFRFYSKTPGTNAKGMVDSNYFIRGYAIHGYADVPPYAASHGCLRVPVPDALPIFRWVRLGDRIDVYR
jgi:peptidoglycan hydrolase-like protein with peptidoglycan-binding domain